MANCILLKKYTNHRLMLVSNGQGGIELLFFEGHLNFLFKKGWISSPTKEAYWEWTGIGRHIKK